MAGIPGLQIRPEYLARQQRPIFFTVDTILQGAAAKLHPLQGADHIINNALINRIIE